MKHFLIIAMLIPISIFSQTYTTPIRVNLDKSMRADRAPMMKLDRSGNIYIAWVSGAASDGSGPISIAVSSDGGMTFNNNLVCSDADCNSNFQRGPQFVIDTKGTIHLVWMGSRVNMQPDVWYTRSSDQGKTWSKPITIDDAGDSSKFAQDFPSIACDSSDNIYVSFLDMRMTQQKLASTPFLYFSRSTDDGKTWTANSRADVPPGGIGGTCECCDETIASTRDGHIYIVYRSNINNLRDIWLARSFDKGMTFQPALKIMTGDWHIEACPVTGPRIALDDSEGAHIVWRDARDDSSMAHLYYAYVPKGSNETPENTSFDAPGAQSANYADIAFYNQGNYKVIAYQTFNYGMRYILSNDNTTLVANRPIQANGSSNKSFANVLFAANGTRYLAWQDDITDAGDIYFMKETSPLPTGISDTLPGSVTLVSPVNFSSNLSLPVNLVWNKAKGADSYHVHVATDSDISFIILDSSDVKDTSIFLTNLRSDTRFAWSVKAKNSTGEGTVSETWSFETAYFSAVRESQINSFSIYPNPVSKENPIIRIERETNMPATMKIIDLLGRQISIIPLGSETSKVISLQNIMPGIYYFILSDGSTPKKIIVGQ